MDNTCVCCGEIIPEGRQTCPSCEFKSNSNERIKDTEMKCAFDRTTLCTALVEKKCHGCSFRKTREELDEGRERAAYRINKLPEEQRDRIDRKYKVSYREWDDV